MLIGQQRLYKILPAVLVLVLLTASLLHSNKSAIANSELVTSTLAAPASFGGKIDPALRTQSDSDSTYFVFLTTQADTSNSLSDWADQGQYVYNQLQTVVSDTQGPLINYLSEQRDAGRVASFRSFWIVNAILVTSDSSLLAELAARNDVAVIWSNGTVRGASFADTTISSGTAITTTNTPPTSTVSENLSYVHAPEAWAAGYNGAGVVVATLDSGVDASHAALVGQYRGASSAIPNDYNFWDATSAVQPVGPYDDNGAGTYLLGTILGTEESGAIGVAPGAKWIAVKTLDATGTASDDQVLAAMQWVLAPTRTDGTEPRPDLRPQVAASSWGSVCGSEIERRAVGAWSDAGIFPSFSAGDNGAGSQVLAPAAYPESFSSGGLDPQSGAMQSTTSAGPSCYDGSSRPQVLAPGKGVWSSVVGGGYSPDRLIGSALAQAQVAGAAALLRSANPDLSVGQTAYYITSTGTLDSAVGREVPALDVNAALGALLSAMQDDPTTTATATATPEATNTQPSDPEPAATSTETATAIANTATATATARAATATATATRTETPASSPTPSCRAQFSDVPPSHWAYNYVRWMFCNGSISGYDDGTFRPLELTSRAQFAKIITLASSWTPENPTTPSFHDVPRSYWAYPYIETVRAHGAVSGYADGTFRPSNRVTRGQLAKMIVESRNWAIRLPVSATFSDVNTRHWAYPWIETAVARGVISGYANGSFGPDQFATRAQLGKMIYAAIGDH